jgi:hypothetical protein
MPKGSYTLDEVIAAERPAWAQRPGGKDDLCHFDGINFWRSRNGRVTGPSLDRDQLPQEGWWHRGGCSCRLCRARETVLERSVG